MKRAPGCFYVAHEGLITDQFSLNPGHSEMHEEFLLHSDSHFYGFFLNLP